MPKLKVYSPEAAYTVAPHGGLKAIEVPGYRMQCDAYVVASSKAKAAAYFAEAGGHSSAPHFHESGRSGSAQALAAAGLLSEDGTVLVSPIVGNPGPDWVARHEDGAWTRLGRLTRGYPTEFVPEED